MKVKNSDGSIQDYRTVWMEGSTIHMVDQKKLPYTFSIYASDSFEKTVRAITVMRVRGAPAIGATAAFAMSQAALLFEGEDMSEFETYMGESAGYLESSRPTAYDLFYAVSQMKEKLGASSDISSARRILASESQRFANESAEMCRLIGVYGEPLISDNSRILTHCNAGALGCVDYGTALAPMRLARDNGKRFSVYVDETRPRFQGAKLTSWELMKEDIPFSVIADNAAGYFMYLGEVDLVIVGADRICANGDVINKVGTYEKAVLAKENDVPFYVAAPRSTFDLSCKSGTDVRIEERNINEVIFADGMGEDGIARRTRIVPEGVSAKYPSFDITPARYVSGIITEAGILAPGDIAYFV